MRDKQIFSSLEHEVFFGFLWKAQRTLVMVVWDRTGGDKHAVRLKHTNTACEWKMTDVILWMCLLRSVSGWTWLLAECFLALVSWFQIRFQSWLDQIWLKEAKVFLKRPSLSEQCIKTVDLRATKYHLNWWGARTCVPWLQMQCSRSFSL